MKTLSDRALNLAQVQGATYADVRIVQRRTQNITVKNGVVETLSDSESQGFGVRVVVDGAWGFASSSRLAPDEVDRITALGYMQACRGLQIVGEPLADLNYVIPTRPDSFRLLSEINRVLLEMREDGTMEALRERWF